MWRQGGIQFISLQWSENRTIHRFSLYVLIWHGRPMLWLFSGGVIFSHDNIRQGISILRESLRLVTVEVFLSVSILFKFSRKGEPCLLLGAIFLLDPNLTLRGATFFLNADFSSHCSFWSREDIKTFLSDFDRVFCGGVRRGVYLDYFGVINKTVSCNICCISWYRAFEGCAVTCFSWAVV